MLTSFPSAHRLAARIAASNAQNYLKSVLLWQRRRSSPSPHLTLRAQNALGVDEENDSPVERVVPIDGQPDPNSASVIRRDIKDLHACPANKGVI
jgi:hypothetical protein